MNVTLPAKQLLDALRAVRGAVLARTTHPVGGRVKVAAGPDWLTVAATDLEVWAAHRIDAPGARPGAAVPDIDRLTTVVQEAGPEVTLAAADAALAVRGSRGKWSLPLADPDAFPDPPQPDAPALVAVVRGPALRLGLKRVGFAIDDHDHERYLTTALLVEPGAGVLLLSATDQVSLALADVEAEVRAAPPKGAEYLLPRKFVRLVAGRLPDGAVELTFWPNTCRLAAGPAVYQTALVAGRVPPWRHQARRMAPGHQAEVVSADLASAVRGAAVAGDDTIRRVEVTIRPGVIAVVGRGSGASAETACDCRYDGPPATFALDPAKVLAFLRTTDGPDVLAVTPPTDKAPVAFRRPDVPGWLFCLAPIADSQ